MSPLPPPPPPGGSDERALAALAQIETRLGNIEEHARVSRAYLGWIVVVVVVIPAILLVVSLLALAGGEDVSVTF